MLKPRYYLGIMSGTSVDAIDVALVEISHHKITFVCGHAFDFNSNLRTQLLHLCENQVTSLPALGELTCQLSKAYAQAVNAFLAKHQISEKDIIAIGCHGQTVYHQPNGEYPFSMQLINASVLAAETSIDVVSDFRSMDIALGGQGAPLVPLFHQAIYQQLQTTLEIKENDHALVFLNIGGISNISIIEPKPLRGFDTGPGNVLLDAWIYHVCQFRYDNNGVFASSGHCDHQLLELLLDEDFFSLPAPKSCGRELFNLNWLKQKISELPIQITDADVMATLVELTCFPIVKSVEYLPHGQLLVCGGGVKNKCIMNALAKQLPTWQVIATDDIGVSSDFMEAMAFAWLAYQSINGYSGNAPQVTGAKRAEICGAITHLR